MESSCIFLGGPIGFFYHWFGCFYISFILTQLFLLFVRNFIFQFRFSHFSFLLTGTSFLNIIRYFILYVIRYFVFVSICPLSSTSFYTLSGISFLFQFLLYQILHFALHGVLLFFCCCCTASATDLREPFYPQANFNLRFFTIFATVPRDLRILERFFYPSVIFYLHFFPTFATFNGNTNLLSSIGLGSSSWSCMASQMWFVTQT